LTWDCGKEVDGTKFIVTSSIRRAENRLFATPLVRARLGC
jgi:hypothetical protein